MADERTVSSGIKRRLTYQSISIQFGLKIPNGVKKMTNEMINVNVPPTMLMKDRSGSGCGWMRIMSSTGVKGEGGDGTIEKEIREDA